MLYPYHPCVCFLMGGRERKLSMSLVKHPVRRIRLKLVPPRGWFHPFEKEFIANAVAWREAIHEMELLDEETAMTLYEFGGDPETVREIAERREDIYDYDLFESGDRLLAYAKFEPNVHVTGFIRLQRDLKVVVEDPARFTDDGGLRVALIGRMDRLREATQTLEDWVEVTVEQIGEYHPQDAQLFHSLTERQRKTLQTALELGYYESPRQATHEDIAAALDRTTATVAEHLQKLESTVLHEIVPE